MNSKRKSIGVCLIVLIIVLPILLTDCTQVVRDFPRETKLDPNNICTVKNTVKAEVAALDQVLLLNRLGAQNVNGMIYALTRDLVSLDSNSSGLGSALTPGHVQLRPDKRPRPLVLRMSKGQCLEVTLTNLLAPTDNPNPHNTTNNPHMPPPNMSATMNSDDQVKERRVGFSPAGLEYVHSIEDSSSYVGKNPDSLVDVGQTKVFRFYAREEGGYIVYNPGVSFGGEATAGNVGNGLFGVVNVEPERARFYRSQVTEEELRLATIRYNSDGSPVIDYEIRYPNTSPWIEEGKAGLPVLNMLDDHTLVHSDLTAIVVGDGTKGRFPQHSYPLESQGKVNPSVPNRLQPFREFTIVFHDENVAAQAFPRWFGDEVMGHTLHGVRDTFFINYGSGGIGAEIIANRLGIGPMHDCASCAYEEFFLSAYAVGDPALLVDKPANVGLEDCKLSNPNPAPEVPDAFENCDQDAKGIKASYAYYPDDPSNVYHSYLNDPVRFRNMHAGKEQHVFHLHANQWLSDPSDENSTYLDSQAMGPGSSYTYEIAFGGTGNRNKLPGDSIFHCHFYPHFAQGMWAMWRSHDTLELGTELKASRTTTKFHTEPWELLSGEPARRSRALPDGEILAGTPIPALVPLPHRPMAPVPGEVYVEAVDKNNDGKNDSSQARVQNATKHPGYPFYIAGIENAVGQRPTTPPLDLAWDGGLPRHTLDGMAAGADVYARQNRLNFTKKVIKAKPIYYPEDGTAMEKLAMAFHEKLCHDSHMPDGSSALCSAGTGGFETNGQKPVPGAPYAEPCIDDRRVLLSKDVEALFRDGTGEPARPLIPQFGADNPRIYKAANIQMDIVFNKIGYHFPQQRIVTLWEDVIPTLDNKRPPEPFVMRLNTGDCAVYQHTNLVPANYEMDDYQVRTPTDIIGQHIHLVKFDVTSSDGSGNGWNYEDGTLSPEAVRERIHAINKFNADLPANQRIATPDGQVTLQPKAHEFFGPLDRSTPDGRGEKQWDGARTTIQRWFADPILNIAGQDRGLGIVFTHDHFGPSTHQQVGLYATLLVEPERSIWKHNEKEEIMYTRHDGGPTSWQARIIPKDAAGNTVDADGDGKLDSFREYFLEFGDFQHAYLKDSYFGVDENGKPIRCGWESNGKIFDDICPRPNSFRFAINPPLRKSLSTPFPDIQEFPSKCPGSETIQKNGKPTDVAISRPCPEAISADDVGMMVVNYRNEPLALRVYDPNATGPDGKKGRQGYGKGEQQGQPKDKWKGSDLAFALQSRTDRNIPELNTQLGNTPYPSMTEDVQKGDPFTSMLRAQEGDRVRIKVQAGSHEHEHNGALQGMKWLQSGGGFGAGAPNSGWRASQNWGISEQATLSAMVGLDKRSSELDVALRNAGSDDNENGCEKKEDDENEDNKRKNNKKQQDKEEERIGNCDIDSYYSIDTGQDGWWSGVWGLFRSYYSIDEDTKLARLPMTAQEEGESAGNRAIYPPKSILLNHHHVLVQEGVKKAIARLKTEIADRLAEQILDKQKEFSDTDSFFRYLRDKRYMYYKADELKQILTADLQKNKTVGDLKLDEETIRLALNTLIERQLVAENFANEIGDIEITLPDSVRFNMAADVRSNTFRTDNQWLLSQDLKSVDKDQLDTYYPPAIHLREAVRTAVGNRIRDRLAGSSTEFINKIFSGWQIWGISFGQAARLRESFQEALIDEITNSALNNSLAKLVFASFDEKNPATGRKSDQDKKDNIKQDSDKQDGDKQDDEKPGGENNAGTNNAGTNNDYFQPGCPAGAPLRSYKVYAVLANKVIPFDPNLGITNVPADNSATMHIGSPPKQDGGTLIYNSRNTVIEMGDKDKSAPLHDPTAIMYLLKKDLEKVKLGKLRPKPLVLRAAAGDCIRIVLKNELPEKSKRMPDLASYSTLLQVAIRDQGVDAHGMRTFQNNLVRASNHVGLQPQLVHYRWQYDGSNVGQNIRRNDDQPLSVAPGQEKVFYWYAGSVDVEVEDGTWYLRYTPVEFGGFNIQPIDKIKQGQKGLVGAGVIHPIHTKWREDKNDRTQATIMKHHHPHEYEDNSFTNGSFRDFVTVFQKGLSLRYKDASAVENIASEEAVNIGGANAIVPEDSHDAGQMAINYGTEPMWLRYGIRPDMTFGWTDNRLSGMAATDDVYMAYSNSRVTCTPPVTSCDPQTAVFKAQAGDPSRMHIVMPTGVGRASTFGLYGHSWQRAPYLADMGVPSQRIGDNKLSRIQSTQESLTPSAHFDIVLPSAGGAFQVPGDYLFRDYGSFGHLNGLWGIMRVGEFENGDNPDDDNNSEDSEHHKPHEDDHK